LNPTAVTPMLLAAAFGHDECVRLLAAHNPAGKIFQTTLHGTICCSHF
jgi:ankyrin repeat protein